MDRRRLLPDVGYANIAVRQQELNVEQRIPSVGISVPGQVRSLQIGGTIDDAALATNHDDHGASVLSVYVIAQTPY